MSEWIYSWLLRLYPAAFQRSYGNDALQLVRDRARDERGFVSRFRLWLDILGDLAISIPGSYRGATRAVATPVYGGTPLFLSLEYKALNLSSLFCGSAASVMFYSVVLLLIGHPGASLPIRYTEASQPSSYSEAAAGSSSSPANEVADYSGASAKPTPRVGLSYTPFPPASGSTVNMTATVFGLDKGPTPTGTIRFFDGDALVGVGSLNHGSVVATGKLPDLPQHFLRAIYNGDSNYSGAASAGGWHGTSHPQIPADAGAAHLTVKPLTFEVVSIHEDKSGAGPQNATSGTTPDGFRARNVSLLTIIQGAYRPSEGSLSFRPNQIIGVPAWAFSQIRYDIDAKVVESDLAMWRNSAQQPEMLRTMLQAMLADRCKLSVHRENKVVPVYELTVGKRSPKLTRYNGETFAEIRQEHPSAHQLTGDAVAAPGPNPGEQRFFGVTVSELGTLLSNLAGRPVLDRTNLTGKYDVSYQIELPPPAQADGTPAPVPPDFFSSQISTIVEGQLGLKLKATTAPVESLVVDHIEQPSEN